MGGLKVAIACLSFPQTMSSDLGIILYAILDVLGRCVFGVVLLRSLHARVAGGGLVGNDGDIPMM